MVVCVDTTVCTFNPALATVIIPVKIFVNLEKIFVNLEKIFVNLGKIFVNLGKNICEL